MNRTTHRQRHQVAAATKRWMMIALAVVVPSLGACGGGTSTSGATKNAASPSSASLSGEITVFAASSLTDAFKEAGAAFSTANPNTRVTFNFAASSALATQIGEGAPADVFASADAPNMQAIVAKGHASAPVVFARNAPVVVVPANDHTIESFADLAKPGIKLVLAGKDVPIGKYARQVLTNASTQSGLGTDFSAKVLANLKSDEANVRAVLTKVQLGEADGGFVYRTDAGAAGNDVRVIEIPSQYNVVAEYPIAVVSESKHPDVAAAFIAFLRSDTGQAILSKFGFTRAGT